MNFWERQFAFEHTGMQALFDLAFGVFLPIFCLLLDPIVFQRSAHPLPGPGILYPRMAPFAYCLIGSNIGILLFFLLLQLRSLLLGGGLLGGAFFSLVLGFTLLPYSIIGLLLGGVFGLTPFLTSFTYFRNYWRIVCFNTHKPIIHLLALSLIGMFLLFSFTYSFHKIVSRNIDSAIKQIACGDSQREKEALNRLLHTRFLFDPDRLIVEYHQTMDAAKQAKIGEVYQKIMGQTIESRQSQLSD